MINLSVTNVKEFTTNSNLKYHIKEIDFKSQSCNACGKCFSNQYKLKLHVTKVHDNHRENVDCDICGKSFIDKYSLNYHVKTVHLKKGLAKCDSCDKEFTHSSGLRKHISMIHENPRMKAIKCSFCEKKLLKNSMDYHIRFVHNKEQNNEKCYKCDRKFAKRGILNRHVRLVHDKEKNHVTIAT